MEGKGGEQLPPFPTTQMTQAIELVPLNESKPPAYALTARIELLQLPDGFRVVVHDSLGVIGEVPYSKLLRLKELAEVAWQSRMQGGASG
jgi:hypothetical protein